MLLYIPIIYLLLAQANALLQNVALLKGQNLTISCNVNSSTQFHSWYFIPVGSNVEKVIYSEHGFNDAYNRNVQLDNSSLSLTISSIQLDDAGLYGCKKLINSTLISEKAQIIVFDSHYHFSNDNSTRLTCEVTYKGIFGPLLEWIQDGPNETIAVNSTLRNDSRADGSYHLTLMTNFVHRTLTCQLYFKDNLTNFGNRAATYLDRCNSSVRTGTTPKTPTPDYNTDSYYKLPSAIIGALLFILIIVVIGLTLEKKRVYRKKFFKRKKKRSKPMELPGPDIAIPQRDTTENVLIEETPEPSSPVYAFIVSDESDYLSAEESETRIQNRIVATDGTEYMMMNTTAGNGTPSTQTLAEPGPSMFTSVMYASIDHTLHPYSPRPTVHPQSPVPHTSVGIYRHTTSNQPPVPSPRNLLQSK